MMLRTSAALLLGMVLLASPAVAQMRATQRISGARLEALAAAKIAALPHSTRLAYRPAFGIADQTVDAGALRLLPGAPMTSPSYVNVPIAVRVNGRYVRTVFVGYHIIHYVQTAVAAHDLAPQTRIEAGDVRIGLVPNVGQNVNGTAVLIGRKTLSAVSAGNPVYVMQTRSVQVVKAGSTVIFILREPGVTLVADVVARTGGGLGDMVSVFNPSTNKTLSGTVVGPNRVELDLPSGMSQ